MQTKEILYKVLRRTLIILKRKTGLKYRQIIKQFYMNVVIIIILVQTLIPIFQSDLMREPVQEAKAVGQETDMIKKIALEEIVPEIVVEEVVETEIISIAKECIIEEEILLQIEATKQAMDTLTKCRYSGNAIKQIPVVKEQIMLLEEKLDQYPNMFIFSKEELESLKLDFVEQQAKVQELFFEDSYNIAKIIEVENGCIKQICGISSEQAYKAKRCTGSALINRIDNPTFGSLKSVMDVITDPGQYGSYINGKFDECKQPSKEHIEIAQDLILNGTEPDIVFQGTELFGQEVIKLGNQYFGKTPDKVGIVE